MERSSEVYLIDDDEAVRSSLSFFLKMSGMVTHTFDSAAAFLAIVDDLAPGCIVTDVRMPEMSGLELLTALTQKGIRQPVIVMTGHADIPLAVAAMKRGATDFLEKPFDHQVFLAAVRAALDADGRIERQAEARKRYLDVLANLTHREEQVLHGVVAGKPNKTIANDLAISPRTVEVHRANMMVKAGVSSVSELVRLTLLGA